MNPLKTTTTIKWISWAFNDEPSTNQILSLREMSMKTKQNKKNTAANDIKDNVLIEKRSHNIDSSTFRNC